MWKINERGSWGAIHGASSAKRTKIVMKHSPTVASGLKRAARSTLREATILQRSSDPKSLGQPRRDHISRSHPEHLVSRSRCRSDVFLVRSFEVLDRAVLEVPNARRDFVNQVVIVRHQQDRAFIALNGG